MDVNSIPAVDQIYINWLGLSVRISVCIAHVRPKDTC